MSSPTAATAALLAPRRHLSDRQARTVAGLLDATVDELREVGYDGLTVRNVARRAGVAPATAYNYFASREHLVTEVFWRRLEALPETRIDRRRTAASRAAATLAEMALLVADEPELAAACTAAMLSNDPDVKVLRDRIGLTWRRRLQAALGDDADPAVLRSLEFAVSGAMLQAGMGHLDYTDLPDQLARTAELVVG
ncbi:MAG TPA: helix-turn-helix domain-containing protein [Microthrixaceae bacterium]|nr:TetR/AcrR family transcriptional regulator [Microthrixaceae bacterium]RTL08045.1 MAG: TetR/AcrR family transcriptional regulator [Acidimicrobiia bacterium]MCB9375664.1 TetR/AcrR family transcriptional regulator [Microthrixaceae bacterium]MCB9402264.1 TetR/AcrR family transcriptional regulator [Microthrixaceae bacterium]MCC6184477.1 TetR/AcrR family transcriptional regulator [Microthrixaceae bacterium]